MEMINVLKYNKGKILFSQGEPASAMYFVLSGKIRIVQRQEEVFATTGAVIGDLAFLTDGIYEYDAYCDTAVQLLSLDNQSIMEVFRKQPQIAFHILKAVARKRTVNGLNFIANEEMAGFEDTEETAVTLVDILPEGHPMFTEKAGDEHEDFLYYKKEQCPVCKTTFDGARIRASRLMAQEHKDDFRTIYSDFEPLWYYILVCPSCLFAYPYRQFTRASEGIGRLDRKAWEQGEQDGSFRFDHARTLDQVFLSYYLALRTYEIIDAPPEHRGNLWLRLVWLYEDQGCEELALNATRQALACFEEAMSTGWRSEVADQRLYIIMGELCLRLDKDKEGFMYYRNAATLKQGDESYRRMAADRIQDLRRIRE